MRTPAQRGRYGRWLVAAREARGFDTAEKALAALASAGITIGRSTYAEYESGGKSPSRNHLPLLEGFWGPVADEAPTNDTSLVAALAAQTDAITALVEELRLQRANQVESTDVLLKAMASVVGNPAPSGKRSGSELVTPAGTAR